MAETAILDRMSTSAPVRHVFISYMREDKEAVDELQGALETLGIIVWRDTENLWPGEDWQAKIRSAIQANSVAFVACFSSAAAAREKSYQYEELTLAVDEFRLRPPSSSWLFTVRFDDCVIPSFSLGGGRTLDSTIHRADLFGKGKTVHMFRLTEAVRRVIDPGSGGGSTTAEAAAQARTADGVERGHADTMKQLLRNPAADIELEDFMGDLVRPLREKLDDDELFPTALEDRSWSSVYPVWRAHVDAYESALEPVLEPVRLAATYGQPQHRMAWERFMSRLTPRLKGGQGLAALVDLRGYPVLVLMHVVAIACEARGNYGPMLSFVVAPRVSSPRQPGQSNPLPLQVNTRSIVDGVEILASALTLSDDGIEVTEDVVAELVSKRRGGRFTPISDHINTYLRELFRDEISEDDEYDRVYDRAEVLLDALALDAAHSADGWYGPQGGFGRYTWRYKHRRGPQSVEATMLADATARADAWAPVVAGLFGGDTDRALSALTRVGEYADSIRSSQH